MVRAVIEIGGNIEPFYFASSQAWLSFAKLNGLIDEDGDYIDIVLHVRFHR